MNPARSVAVVEIWTDGSGATEGPWGAAAVLRYVDGHGEVHEREVLAWGDLGTNNVAELTAVAIGLEELTRPCHVRVFTDSEYVMFGFEPCDGQMTGRLERWERKGWKTANKAAVKNRALWERLAVAVGRHRCVEWHHVKGHTGVELNERADKLAGRARLHAKGDLQLSDLLPEAA